MADGRELDIEIGEPAKGRLVAAPVGAAWTRGMPPQGEGPLIYISDEAAALIHKHAQTTLRLELGGLLIGEAGYTEDGRPIAVVHGAIAVDGKDSSGTHFVFGGHQQKAAYEKLDRRYPGSQIVGWYHTHPRMSVFLSGTDLNSHRSLFAIPWQVALVLEPESNQAGFFGWTQRDIRPIDSYAAFSATGASPSLPWKAPGLPLASPVRQPTPANLRNTGEAAPSVSQAVTDTAKRMKPQRTVIAALAVAGLFGFLLGYVLPGRPETSSTAEADASPRKQTASTVPAGPAGANSPSPTVGPTTAVNPSPTTAATPLVVNAQAKVEGNGLVVTPNKAFDPKSIDTTEILGATDVLRVTQVLIFEQPSEVSFFFLPAVGAVTIPRQEFGKSTIDSVKLEGTAVSRVSHVFMLSDGTKFFVPFVSNDPQRFASVFFTDCKRWVRIQDAAPDAKKDGVDSQKDAQACN